MVNPSLEINGWLLLCAEPSQLSTSLGAQSRRLWLTLVVLGGKHLCVHAHFLGVEASDVGHLAGVGGCHGGLWGLVFAFTLVVLWRLDCLVPCHLLDLFVLSLVKA